MFNMVLNLLHSGVPEHKPSNRIHRILAELPCSRYKEGS
jgi:hypothetical protein